MGYGHDAINVIRNNRSLVKKPKFNDVKKLVLKTSNKTELEFKKISKEELERIKSKIRKDAKRNAAKEILVYGSLAVILF